MATIKLVNDPTFKAKVGIPVPGGSDAPVEFTFKWRTKTEAKAWLDTVEEAKPSDAEAVQAMATGWSLDDAFTAENIARLCDVYGGASHAILTTYLRELAGARAKN